MKFKNYLIEVATSESTEMEYIIIACWNTISKFKSKNKFISEILKDKRVTKFIKTAKKIQIPNDLNEGAETLYLFAKNLDSKINVKGTAKPAGQSSPKTSSYWAKETGKGSDISKADILIGKKQVSLKNKKAQLMSGKKQESIATANSAMEESNLSKKVFNEVIDVLNNFADNTRTLGYTTAEISKMKKTDLKDSINKKAKAVYVDADKAKGEAKDILNKSFDNELFRNSFAYEAMTGWEKFGGRTFNDIGDDIGRADSMLIFEPTLKSVIWENVESSKNKYVKKISGKMGIDVSMKSSSYKQGGKKVGYNFYQVIRLGIDTAFSEVDKLQEEIKHSEQLLFEDKINEIDLKGIIDKIKSKLRSLWNGFVDSIKNMVKKLKELMESGIVGVLNFFDLTLDVKVNPVVNLM